MGAKSIVRRAAAVIAKVRMAVGGKQDVEDDAFLQVNLIDDYEFKLM